MVYIMIIRHKTRSVRDPCVAGTGGKLPPLPPSGRGLLKSVDYIPKNYFNRIPRNFLLDVYHLMRDTEFNLRAIYMDNDS
jgi:hypothetical protein